MSLFFGKNVGGVKPQLHITRGTNTEAEMMGGPRDNTVFHSDLPYITVVDFFRGAAERINHREAGNVAIDGYRIELPAHILNKIIEGYQYVVLYHPTYIHNDLAAGGYIWETYAATEESMTYQTSGGYEVRYSKFFGSGPTPTGTIDWPNTNWARSPSTARKWMFLSTAMSQSGPIGEIGILVLNIKNHVYQPIPNPFPDTRVLLDRTQFLVGGVHVTDIDYLSRGEINPTDLRFRHNGTVYQVVGLNGARNASLRSGRVDMEADATGASISHGGKPIFTTRVAGVKNSYKESFTYSSGAALTLQTTSNANTNKLIPIAPAGTFDSDTPLVFSSDSNHHAKTSAVVMWRVGNIGTIGNNYYEFRQTPTGPVRTVLRELVSLVGAEDGSLSLWQYLDLFSSGNRITAVSHTWNGQVHSFR